VAAERVPVAGLHPGVGAAEPMEEAVEEVLKAEDVLPVVLEGRLQGRAPAAAEVVEVRLRDQVAGDVVLPLEAEQPFFHGAQGAPLEAGPEQAPGEVEEVDVVALAQLARHSSHQPAGAEQGEVEAHVVRDEHPVREQLEELPAIADVPVERRRLHVQPVRQSAHRQRVESLFVNQAEPGRDQRGAAQARRLLLSCRGQRFASRLPA